MTDVLAPDTGTARRRRRAPRGQGEKLRAEILCAAERLLRETGDQEAVAGSDDPLESLRLQGRAYVHFGLDHPEEYRILFMTRPAASPEGWNEARVKEGAAFHHLVQAVQATLDAGAIRPANAILVAFGLWTAMHGLTSLFVAKPGLFGSEREALIDHVLDVQIAGLVTPTPAPRAGEEPPRSAAAAPRRHRGRTALAGR